MEARNYGRVRREPRRYRSYWRAWSRVNSRRETLSEIEKGFFGYNRIFMEEMDVR